MKQAIYREFLSIKRRNHLIPMMAFACILITFFLASFSQAQDKAEKKAASPQFLFVQSAKSFTYADGTLSLHGLSPHTIYFTDRPVRIAGHVTVQDFIDWGLEAEDSFSEDPPNATLSIIAGDEAINIVMVLSNAQLAGDTLSYNVRILEGQLPKAGGVNSLFIDVIGRPLTPVSVAGVNRRWRRRAVVVGAGTAAAYGTAAATAAAAQPTTIVVDQPEPPAAPPPTAAAQTTESKLTQLKSMLDNGLISQSEYESKKKQLLANF